MFTNRASRLGSVLPLGELHSSTCAAEAVLLAFFHARVAGEKAAAAKRGERFTVEGDERSGDAHLASEGLPIGAAAGAGDDAIDLLALARGVERVEHRLLLLNQWKILVHLPAVHGDLAAAGANSHPSDRLLAPSGAEAIAVYFVFLRGNHC